MAKQIHIGGGAGYWGESLMATPQLLRDGRLDYIIYDYLAEITMSIMARAKAKNPEAGFATDFITGVLAPHLPTIAKQGVKLITNAGGVNPQACGKAAEALVAKAGLDLKVAVIDGDDLTAQARQFHRTAIKDMFSGADFPPPEAIASINAYLGAFPIAQALARGADIIITGRVADSALALGACIHAFGWGAEEWDKLAAGSLVGHIIECGPQATGGNFTDWQQSGDLAEIGYPIAEISPDGSFICTKPQGTGGVVSPGSVGEQLLYEIGDPQAYCLPDVICDFSQVQLAAVGENQVRVCGAKGRPAPDAYKICATFADGFRGGVLLGFTGLDAKKAAQTFSHAVLKRSRALLREHNLADFSQTSEELLGAESQFGKEATSQPSELVLKLAVRHEEATGVGLFLRQVAGLGLATPPGMASFAGGRAKPSPVVRLFSFLWPSEKIQPAIHLGGKTFSAAPPPASAGSAAAPQRASPPPAVASTSDKVQVSLMRLAFGRSGDKGNKANIGLMARHPDFMPYLWQAVDEDFIRTCFAHFLEKDSKIERFFLPGLPGMNLLLHDVLGGGGIASLRQDAQGKAYAQILLAQNIAVPAALAQRLEAYP